MIITKKPLPTGTTQSFKSSVLDQALRESGVEIHTKVAHVHEATDFFEAWFHPSSTHHTHERIEIVARSVPARVGGEVHAYAHHMIIPDMVKWIRGILSVHEDSSLRKSSQRFVRDMPDVVERKDAVERFSRPA